MASWFSRLLGWLRLLLLLGFIFVFLLRMNGTNERNATNYSYKYSHRILRFRFLDSSGIAFIQRDSTNFWMHVRRKRNRRFNSKQHIGEQ
jgi:hypothetical protein